MEVFDDYAKYYDLMYKDKDFKSEAEYIINLIRGFKSDAKNILDLGCGTGRHCTYFRGNGFEVTGVERSGKMLEIANNSLKSGENLSPGIDFVNGDIRNFRTKKKFDIITSLFLVMNYQVTNEDLRSTLRTVDYHLSNGGKFIFDFWYGPAVLHEKPESRYRKIEDSGYEIERFAEPNLIINENIVEVDYRILIKELKSGTKKEINESHRLRYLFLPEISLLLNEINMEILRSEVWMTGEQLSDKSWYGLVIAGKK